MRPGWRSTLDSAGRSAALVCNHISSTFSNNTATLFESRYSLFFFPIVVHDSYSPEPYYTIYLNI